jgi:hypothetical protein
MLPIVRMQIVTPSSVMTRPGTYRLTVIDQSTQRGDAFIVARDTTIIVPPGTTLPVVDAAPSARAVSDARSGETLGRAVLPALFEGPLNTLDGDRTRRRSSGSRPRSAELRATVAQLKAFVARGQR